MLVNNVDCEVDRLFRCMLISIYHVQTEPSVGRRIVYIKSVTLSRSTEQMGTC